MIDMLVDFAILDASVENDNLKSNKAVYQKKLSYYVELEKRNHRLFFLSPGWQGTCPAPFRHS